MSAWLVMLGIVLIALAIAWVVRAISEPVTTPGDPREAGRGDW